MSNIEERVPEIELGKTCSIVVMPLYGNLLDSHRMDILGFLELVSLAFYHRVDEEGRHWRIFVVPFRLTSGELWNDIFRYFGSPKYYEKVC